MKLTAIGLATALALTSTMAFAQSAIGTAQSTIGTFGGNSVTGGSAASGFTTGSSTSGSTTGSAGGSLGNNAGGAAAGANSTFNPSGNSFINTSPSGSTLMQGGAAPSGGR